VKRENITPIWQTDEGMLTMRLIHAATVFVLRMGSVSGILPLFAHCVSGATDNKLNGNLISSLHLETLRSKFESNQEA
jgi:hypothetical protein